MCSGFQSETDCRILTLKDAGFGGICPFYDQDTFVLVMKGEGERVYVFWLLE